MSDRPVLPNAVPRDLLRSRDPLAAHPPLRAVVSFAVVALLLFVLVAVALPSTPSAAQAPAAPTADVTSAGPNAGPSNHQNNSSQFFQETFSESGLPSPAFWVVTVVAVGTNGSSSIPVNGPSASYAFADGNYSFSVNLISGYLASPASGTFNTTANYTVAVTFTAGGYPVVFSGFGLPNSTYWYVTIDGTLYGLGNSTPTISWVLGNGTYTFVVGGAPGYTPSPASGNFTVAGNTTTVVIAFTAYGAKVAFQESGLPNGTLWSVVYNGNGGGAPAGYPISFPTPNGTFSYFLGNVTGYVPTPSNGTVVVNGFNVTVSITFSLAPSYYVVTFTETGLPAGMPWSVYAGFSAINSSSSSIGFAFPNGTWAFTVQNVSAYVPSPASGSFSVAGGPTTISVLFATTIIPTPPTYSLTFSETGLPSGTPWTVNVSGSSSSGSLGNSTAIIMFTESNGTYAYTVANAGAMTPTPGSGSVAVSGASVSVSITFSTVGPPPASYAVSLGETGLPSGTLWSADLGGATQSSTTATIGFTEPNGSFVLTVPAVGNYTANYSSPVLVNGGPVSVTVTFTNTSVSNGTYPVTFLEAGLPSGATWTVSVTETSTQAVTSGQSATSTITLHLKLGTYWVSVNGPAGYRVTLSSTVLGVSGAGSTAPLSTFTVATPGAIAPASLPWATVAVLVITGVVGVVGAGWGYGRYQYARRREEAQRWFREFREDPHGSEKPPK